MASIQDHAPPMAEAGKGSQAHPGAFPEFIEQLARMDLASPGLDRELQRMAEDHGDAVYSELIYMMCHLRFSPAEARMHWERIGEHRAALTLPDGMPPDPRVALLGYFIDVNRKYENPKIIEMKLFEQTRESAYSDELTGLRNYRVFREYLSREIERSDRYSTPLSLVMIDVDNFKSYNDSNGHEVGNEALVQIADLLRESLRKVDLPARYGGEEFALILPSTPKQAAGLVAERTRTRIEESAFARQELQPGGRLTVSMGVATFPADATDASQLVRCADRAMYVAKEAGKNRVQLYGESRRSYRRIRAALDGNFCVVSTACYPMTTQNVSEGGLLCTTDRNFPLGSLIDVELQLPDGEFNASGRVIRVEEKTPGDFETAICLLNADPHDRVRLVRFLRTRESAEDAEPVTG